MVFLTVTLPLALPGVIAGVVLCFARALGEFGATITFVSNIPGETQTISAAIYTLLQVPDGDAAAARLVLVAIAHRARRADRFGMVRAPRRHALPRGMSVLAVDVEKQLGTFKLAARFEAAGGVTALFGPSGAGKTTIVNMIAGLLTPDRGSIALDETVLFDAAAGINVPPHRRRIGYVFQEGRLFPHLSVRQNLDYGRRMSGHPHDADEFERIVDACSISATCSIGGRACCRAASASASRSAARLLMRPRLLLLDEPLASLDCSAQARNPSLSGAAARRGRRADGLCQPHRGGSCAGSRRVSCGSTPARSWPRAASSCSMTPKPTPSADNARSTGLRLCNRSATGYHAASPWWREAPYASKGRDDELARSAGQYPIHCAAGGGAAHARRRPGDRFRRRRPKRIPSA